MKFGLQRMVAVLVAAALGGAGAPARGASQADIPEAEVTLIRAIGFIDGPRIIARACAKANPSSAEGWAREVASFEQRRAAESARTHKLFADTYSAAIAAAEAQAIVDAKIEARLADEAAAKHIGTGTLCLVVSLLGGKRAFETKGFEETMQSLASFERAGEYQRLRERIAEAAPESRSLYRERLLAYQPKPAK